MNKHAKRLIPFVLVLVMAFLAVPFNANAATVIPGVCTYKVSVADNVFTITREGDTSVRSTVQYRTVGHSALEDVHFRRAAGTLYFDAGETTKTVTVTEIAAANVPVQFRYQNSNRVYRFEVLDPQGFLLTYGQRSINYGDSYKFNNTYVSEAADVVNLLYYHGESSSNPSSMIIASDMPEGSYLDVAHSGSANRWVEIDDGDDYCNAYNISASGVYTRTGIPQAYYTTAGDKLYTTVFFNQKEKDDGYQYIQILADNSSSYDAADPDGKVNNPSLSGYKACFILSYDKKVITDERMQYFPHRYDAVDRSDGDNYGQHQDWRYTEFAEIDSHLYQQKFKSTAYRAENTGAVVFPTASSVTVRFDAAGSGDDTWYFKDLKARFALVDDSAPYPITGLNYAVDTGAHLKYQKVTVCIPFNEIVTVNTDATLETSWGTLKYTTGSGTNVLAFTGAITANSGTTLSVGSLNGTVQDLMGHVMTASVARTVSATVGAVQVPGTVNGKYAISTISDLFWFFDTVANRPNISAVLMNNLEVGSNASYEVFKGMCSSSAFVGTFDGQGYTIADLYLVTRDVDYGGFFCRIGPAGVLRNLTLTGYYSYFYTPMLCGGFCGLNHGTIERCSVTGRIISSGLGQDARGKAIGGLCGQNNGTIHACRVLAGRSGYVGNYWKNNTIAALVGFNNGTVENCYALSEYDASNFDGNNSFMFYGTNSGTFRNCAGADTSVNDRFGTRSGTNTGTDENNSYFKSNYSGHLENPEFVSGEVCYIANGGVTDGTQVWYQTIGTDAMPEYSGATVYHHGNIYTNDNSHVLSHVDAVVPDTCLEDGVAEHWVCTIDGCGKIFSDANGVHETTLDDLTVPATGHDYVGTHYEWADDCSSVTCYSVCSVCQRRNNNAVYNNLDPANDLTVCGRTVIFDSTFSARYLLLKEDFDFYLEKGATVDSFTLTLNGEVTDVSSVIGSDQVVTIDGADYYWVKVSGIAAKDIETAFTFTLVCSINGTLFTDTYTDSVNAALFQAAGENGLLSEAANATLAYCMEAAYRFGKVNAISYYTVSDASYHYTPMQSHSVGSGALRICGTSLLLKDELAIKFWARTGEFAGTVDDLVVMINNEVAHPVRANNGDYFTFKIPVPVNMANTPLTIELLLDGDPVSNVYTDSVVDYALSMTGEDADLGRAILDYVYYANVYLDPTTATGYVPSGEELPPVNHDPQ